MKFTRLCTKRLCEWVQGRHKILSLYFFRLNERKKYQNIEKIVGASRETTSLTSVIKFVFAQWLLVNRIPDLQLDIWKIIYLNCREGYENMTDHRSYIPKT